MSEDEKTMPLYADDLLSKWGFGDGDRLFDWWWDKHEQDTPFDDHDVLYALAIQYLVPLLEFKGHSVKLQRIETSHNPVRASEVDGEEVDWHQSWNRWGDLSVEVTEAQILAAAQKVDTALLELGEASGSGVNSVELRAQGVGP